MIRGGERAKRGRELCGLPDYRGQSLPQSEWAAVRGSRIEDEREF